jgi:hypothetical protein
MGNLVHEQLETLPAFDRELDATQRAARLGILLKQLRPKCRAAVELACYLQLLLLIRPNVSDREVESKNPAVHCLDQFREPFLQCHSLLSALGAHPKRQLGDDD